MRKLGLAEGLAVGFAWMACLAAAGAQDTTTGETALPAVAGKIGNISAKPDLKARSQDYFDLSAAFAGSSTLSIKADEAIVDGGETLFTDDAGRSVTVRIFPDESARSGFDRLFADKTLLEKSAVETDIVAGVRAIRKRNEDGVSILIAGENAESVIEIESASEAAVVSFIENLDR